LPRRREPAKPANANPVAKSTTRSDTGVSEDVI
jgi:hypothetical protein